MAMQTPGLQLGVDTARPVVGDLQVLVHLRADAVADVRPDDVAPALDRHVLHGPGDVLDVRPGTAAAMPAIRARRVVSMSRATSAGGLPT